MRARASEPALAQAAGRLREAGVEVRLDASGVALAARARTLIKSPGVPQDAPAIRGGASAWRRGPRRARARVAAAPQRVRRRDRHQRQDDHDRMDRPRPPRGRAAGGGRRQRRHRGVVAGRPVRSRRRRSCARRPRSSSRTRVAFSPEAAVLLNLVARPPRPPRRATRTTWRPSCGSSPTRATTTSRWRRPTSGSRTSGVRAPGAVRRRRRARALRPRRLSVVGRAADRPRRRDRAARARTTARTRWPTAAACLARGVDPEAVATGLRTFAGVRHRLERIAVKDGVAWVNDSKATNVASTIVALRAFAGGDPPDRRRARQAAGLLAAGAARRRALPGGVPDRRGGGRARARRWPDRRPARARPAISSARSRWRARPPRRRRGRAALAGVREL